MFETNAEAWRKMKAAEEARRREEWAKSHPKQKPFAPMPRGKGSASVPSDRARVGRTG